MSQDGAEWWGGYLADGSLVVLSPSGRALFLSDSSASTGLQPGAGRKKSASAREWLAVRSGIPFPYGKSGHSIGLRRGTVILGIALLLTSMTLVNWLVEAVFHSTPTAFFGGLVTLAIGMCVCALLLSLVYAIEVVPLKRQGIQFINVEEDSDDYLRYVHPKVSGTEEWGVLTVIAQEHSPPSEKAQGIHDLMWEVAGIKPTLDAGEIRPSDLERLSETALLARGL